MFQREQVINTCKLERTHWKIFRKSADVKDFIILTAGKLSIELTIAHLIDPQAVLRLMQILGSSQSEFVTINSKKEVSRDTRSNH